VTNPLNDQKQSVNPPKPLLNDYFFWLLFLPCFFGFMQLLFLSGNIIFALIAWCFGYAYFVFVLLYYKASRSKARSGIFYAIGLISYFYLFWRFATPSSMRSDAQASLGLIFGPFYANIASYGIMLVVWLSLRLWAIDRNQDDK